MSISRKLKYLVPSYRRAVERDIREELESLAAIADSLQDRRELGSLARAAEEARAVWGWVWAEQLWADVRFAFRSMWQNRGFTATAVLSLALAIGANTAIFSLINAILLKTLPVNHPESLVVLTSLSRDGQADNFSYSDYRVLRDGNRSFSGVLAASSQQRVNVGWGTETESVLRKVVSDNYFSVLGVQPTLGRSFSSEDENLPVAIVSNGFWKRSLAGSLSAVGKQIDLDGSSFTIIGIAPPDFFGETDGEAPDIWATMSLIPASRRDLPGFTWLNLMGRLAPGVQFQRARADLSIIVPQLPDSVARGGFIDQIGLEAGDRGGSGLRESFSTPLHIVMAVVAVVLLIACANLASLQLARAAKRRTEIATRLALGAGRGRIVRQLLTESLVLALLGGAFGLLFAIWSERALLTLVAGVGRVINIDLRPDLSVLVFTLLISILTGMLFGLAPALQAVWRSSSAGLKADGRILAGHGRRFVIKDSLIAIQVALSLLLLIVGGLFIRTIQNLKDQDVGFRPGNVLTVQISSQSDNQPNWATVIGPLLQRTQAIPGVKIASVSFNEILANESSGVMGISFDGYSAPKEPQKIGANWVGPNYFATSGIAILEGREFSYSDNAGTQRVAIINETMARKYIGSGRALGHQLQLNNQRYEVIGIAKDAKYMDLRESASQFVYFAGLQNSSDIHSLEVRTIGSPLAIAGAVRSAVHEVDPLLRIGEITTLSRRVDQELAREFLIADIATFFSVLTLLLVSIGIYGTLAYAVARRTSEIGIRIALGAQAAAVLRLILRDVLWMLVVGLVAGLSAALAVGQLLSSMFFGLKPTDVPTIGLAVLVLCATTLAAAYFPARRASRVDPSTALRLQ
jgi:predicted permease